MTLKWSLIFRFSERIQAFISICGLMVWVLYIYVTSRTNKQLWPIKVSIYPAHLTGHKKHIVLCQTKRLKVSLKKDTWSIKLIHGQRLPGIKKKRKRKGLGSRLAQMDSWGHVSCSQTEAADDEINASILPIMYLQKCLQVVLLKFV